VGSAHGGHGGATSPLRSARRDLSVEGFPDALGVDVSGDGDRICHPGEGSAVLSVDCIPREVCNFGNCSADSAAKGMVPPKQFRERSAAASSGSSSAAESSFSITRAFRSNSAGFERGRPDHI
jgi:hypothetical protein